MARLAQLGFQERRRAIKEAAGFVCKCASCVAEEREWSAAGRAAARKRLAERRRAGACGGTKQAPS